MAQVLSSSTRNQRMGKKPDAIAAERFLRSPDGSPPHNWERGKKPGGFPGGGGSSSSSAGPPGINSARSVHSVGNNQLPYSANSSYLAEGGNTGRPEDIVRQNSAKGAGDPMSSIVAGVRGGAGAGSAPGSRENGQAPLQTNANAIPMFQTAGRNANVAGPSGKRESPVSRKGALTKPVSFDDQLKSAVNRNKAPFGANTRNAAVNRTNASPKLVLREILAKTHYPMQQAYLSELEHFSRSQFSPLRGKLRIQSGAHPK